MIDEKLLRSELVRQPQPAKIIVRDQDDAAIEVAGATPGKGGRTWAAVARTIMAMGPKLVELYDAKGVLLRAVDPESGSVEQSQAGETLTAAARSYPILHSDPETARLTHFANLLSEAWRFSTGLAFEKIVDIVQAQADRAIALEQRAERAERAHREEMHDRLQEQFDQVEAIRDQAAAGDTAGAQELFESFAANFLAGRQEAAANGKPAAKPAAKPGKGNGA